MDMMTLIMMREEELTASVHRNCTQVASEEFTSVYDVTIEFEQRNISWLT